MYLISFKTMENSSAECTRKRGLDVRLIDGGVAMPDDCPVFQPTAASSHRSRLRRLRSGSHRAESPFTLKILEVGVELEKLHQGSFNRFGKLVTE